VEWDKYHRNVLKLSRAYETSWLATELLSVGKELDRLFHMGDGTKILRLAAAQTGAPLRRMNLPNVTRSSLGMRPLAGSVLVNFKNYASSVFAREAWRFDDHHKGATAAEVLDIGRRLTSVALVSFTLVFVDYHDQTEEPWLKQIQSTTRGEPWALEHERRERMRRESRVQGALYWIREFVRVIYLLSQHAPPTDLRNLARAAFYARASDFWRAFGGPFTEHAPVAQDRCRVADCARGSAWARVLPRFMLALPSLACLPCPTFHDAELLAVVPPAKSRSWCLGSHCQCAFLASREQSADPLYARAQVRGRMHTLPAWVVNSPRGGVRMHSRPGELQPAPLRVHYRDPDAPLPLGLAGSRDLFRHGHRVIEGGHVSNCRIRAIDIEVFKEIDAGLAGMEAVGLSVLEAGCSLFSETEGMNAGMARAFACMNQCFDFSRLVREAPTDSDVTAFKQLARMLLPILRRTEWPPYPEVVRGWPRKDTLEAGLEALARQYALLMHRVRAASTARPRLAASWWRTTGYRVTPVAAREWLLRLTRQRCARFRPGANDVANAAALISAFVFGAPSWRLSARLLVALGYPKRKTARMNGRTWQRWQFRPGRSPGGLCTALLPSCKGKLLRVTETLREVDVSAVSAAIDSDEYFARGLPSTGPAEPRRSAWHVVKVHNQSRTMNAVEAANERIGSVMGTYCDKRAHPNASAVLDRTMLHEAGVQCAGDPQDEELVAIVANTFRQLGLSPEHSARSLRHRRELAQSYARLDAASSSESDSSAESAVGSGAEDRAREALSQYGSRKEVLAAAGADRARSMPEMSATDGLRRALAGVDHVVKKQRLFHDLQRDKADGADDRLTAWMDGREGRAWLTQRETRLRAHLPPGVKPC